MSRHLDTLRRHKFGLVLPVVLALVLSGWYASRVTPKYLSGTTVWFDTAIPQASSLVNPPNGGTTPAGAGQQVLTELLGSPKFLVNVGRRGPLAKYLESTGVGGGDPAAVDREIVSDLSKAFTISTTGPQVVQITITTPYANIATGTLNALVAEYSAEVSSQLATRGTASVAYVEAQVQAAKKTLDRANSAATAYQAAHPGANATSDATYSQLVQAAFNAQSNYEGLEQSYVQAQLSLNSVNSQATFHVLDPASTVSRLSIKKKMVFDVAAGLLAGMVISVLALAALTRLDRTARKPEDIKEQLGMDVVATVSQLPKMRRGLKEARAR